ncbi:MAG: CaiB/BaiF CoA transferase family protein [Acidimicrobiales bacterium]
MPGSLDGITVLDLSVVGPATRCTRLLADYGADVVKVGPVLGPAVAQEDGGGPPFFAYSAGRGMRSIQVDLRTEQGRELFLVLAAESDVIVESFRPGVVDRLGIGYEAVRAVNHDVIYVSTTGYGQDGPRAGWAGHDLDYLAVGGFMSMSGGGVHSRGGAERRTPPLPGATIADGAAGGMHAALAVCAALVARAAGGGGAHLDVAVADGVLWLMSLAAEEYLAVGGEIRPGHDVLSGRYACYGVYGTADARYVAVGAIEPKFFANLCRLLGCPELAPRQYDDSAQPGLHAEFVARFAARTRDEWVELMAGEDTCVAPVLNIEEVVDDAQFLHRSAVVEAQHPTRGPLRQLGAVLAGTAALDRVVAVPDRSATDTRAVLAEAGVPPDRVEQLIGAGVVA